MLAIFGLAVAGAVHGHSHMAHYKTQPQAFSAKALGHHNQRSNYARLTSEASGHTRSKQLRHMAMLMQSKSKSKGSVEMYVDENMDASAEFRALQAQCAKCESAEDAAVATFEAAALAHEAADIAASEVADAHKIVDDKEKAQENKLDMTLEGKEAVIEAIEALETILEDLDLETEDQNAKPADQLGMVLTTSESGSTAWIKLKIAELKVLINDQYVPAVKETHAAEEDAEDKEDAYKKKAQDASAADTTADTAKAKRDDDCTGTPGFVASPSPSPSP